MRRTQLRVLVITAIGLMLFWMHASAAAAPVDGSELLRSLRNASDAELKATADRLTKAQPEQTGKLALDLIFYRWATKSYELEPGIDRLDQIASALVAASSDRSVIWAAAELGPTDWGARAVLTDDDNEHVKSLKDARHALRTAVSFSYSSPSRSIENLNVCLELTRKMGLELSEAFINTRLGERYLYATSRYRDAESHYDRARPTLSAYNLRAQVAQIYQDLGYINMEAGRFDEAQEKYASSAEQWKAAGRDDHAGEQYVNAGVALAAQGKERAFLTMQIGLNLSRSYAAANKQYESHARLLLRVASFCSSRGLYENMRALLSEQGLTDKLGDTLVHAEILRSLADAYTAIKQEPRARAYLTERTKVLSRLAQKGLEAAAKLNGQSLPASEQSAILAAAETGAAASAQLDKYQQAIDLIRPVIAVYETQKRDQDKIRALRSLADYQEGLKDKQALLTRIQAAKLANTIGRPTLAVEICRDIQASAHRAGDSINELEALREAVQVIEQTSDMRARADMLYARGTLLDSMGQTSLAMVDLQRAAEIYTTEVGEPWSAARANSKLAEVKASTGQTREAIATWASAIKQIEEWAQEEGVDPSLEPDRSDLLHNLYLQVTGLLIREGAKDEAAEHLRRAKRLNYGWLGRLMSLLKSSGDPKAADVINAVGQYIAPPAVRPGQARKVAVGWHAVLTQSPFSPFTGPGRNPVKSVVDAAELYKVRSKLPPDTAVLAYAVRDVDIYVLVATKKTAVCWEIPGVSDSVVEAVQLFHKVLKDTEASVAAGMSLAPVKSWKTPDPKLAVMLDPLFGIEEKLFDPIRGDLQQAKVTSLIVALPDKMAGIPFHALPQQKSGIIKFVIQDFAVSYLGKGVLQQIVSGNKTPIVAKKEAVAIFPGSGLPGAMKEALRIKAYFPNSKLLANITADRFVREACSAGIVHIAAHHEPDPDPANISIVLSGKPGGTGTIRLTDLININNPGLHLAVLSACESVGATGSDAMSTTHIAEAFALAGFPSFIGGMWKVSDAASANLMAEFYQRLARTGKKAESLRQAQKSMIESRTGEYAHPFFWGGFALYGDPH